MYGCAPPFTHLSPFRPGQIKHFPPHRRLLFNVAAAMPRLEMELQGLPKGMYQGEVAACTAVLVNHGTLPLRNLQLVLSCPEVRPVWVTNS